MDVGLYLLGRGPDISRRFQQISWNCKKIQAWLLEGDVPDETNNSYDAFNSAKFKTENASDENAANDTQLIQWFWFARTKAKECEGKIIETY